VKALLVEDDPDLRGLVASVLAERGHEVADFAAAEAAWEAYQRERFPLVVVDWRLPGIDGNELSRRIRALPGGDVSAILMMTGRSGAEDLAAALEAGASDYLPKPFELDDLEVRLSIAEKQAEMLAGRAALLERERMARAQSETATQRIRTLVASAVEAQTAEDEEGVFQATGAAIVRVGLNGHIATLEPTRQEGPGLVIRHVALTDQAMRDPIEQRLGRPIVGLWIDPTATEVYRTCCQRGGATLLPDAALWLQEALPWLDERAARALGRLRQVGHGICAPITDGRVVLGALSVWGEALGEVDVPALELLGRVAGGALAAQRLRASDRARARLDGALLLARTAAHELSTALGLAAGYADLLAAHPTVVGDAVLAEYAREAQEGAAQAARTLSRLQHVIRLEENPSPLGADKGVLDLERSTTLHGS
jgi:DNA-binding response OmpR family regulator